MYFIPVFIVFAIIVYFLFREGSAKAVKSTEITAPHLLMFKMQCEFGDTKLEVGRKIFGYVDEHTKLLPQLGGRHARTACLVIASPNGGFTTVAHGRGPALHPGDMVLWEPTHQRDSGEFTGKIVAKLATSQDLASPWNIETTYS